MASSRSEHGDAGNILPAESLQVPSAESRAAAWLLDDGRLHLNHGPIDLVVSVDASKAERQAAFTQATRCFRHILDDLVAELAQLREVVSNDTQWNGSVARRQWAAVWPYRRFRVTPMIAVAGAVADEVLSALCEGRCLSRASVNNGGDIALYLDNHSVYVAAVCSDIVSGSCPGTITVSSADGVGGMATSGWRGRSHSLGIADSVTVLATTAALADVAATLIANAVDCPESPRVQRQPARTLDPDSDLEDRLVTVDVGVLSPAEKNSALEAGVAVANRLMVAGQVRAVWLNLQGEQRRLHAADSSGIALCARTDAAPHSVSRERETHQAHESLNV